MLAPETPPAHDAPALRLHPETGERYLDLLRWGFVPHFTTDLKAAAKPINARAETVARSGMFRDSFARRRCLVPASAFYEWQARPDGKQPYAIAHTDDAPMALAGIWSGWRAADSGEVLRTFAIITTTASALMRPIHDRMPVIIEEPDWPVWLGETDGDPVVLLHPAANGRLRLWPVGRAVNSVRNDGPELLLGQGGSQSGGGLGSG